MSHLEPILEYTKEDRIKSSPNYRDGEFQNQLGTRNWDLRYMKGTLKALVGTKESRPKEDIPTAEVKWSQLPKEDFVIWLGHSSVFLQLDGMTILVDPVFHASAAPIAGLNRSFRGTNGVSVEELPEIDILIVTHDHFDHMDYRTLKQLRKKVRYAICPLGVDRYLKKWGYHQERVLETDWYEAVEINGMMVYTLPARHNSGRGIKTNQTLWASFLFKSKQRKIYLSGDSGYGPHFKEIGEMFGTVDLAIMENGQYHEELWPDVHMMPEELVKAVDDLNARAVIPVHNSKFSMSLHAWNEPLERLNGLQQGQKARLQTPMMGQIVSLAQNTICEEWWKNTKTTKNYGIVPLG